MEAAQMTNKMSEGGKSKFNSEWNTEELQLLIKSVNLFPAGTVNRYNCSNKSSTRINIFQRIGMIVIISCFRWEVCAEFINQHSNCQKSAKEVLAKAKEMQSGNFAMSSLKEEVNKMAYENLQKGTCNTPRCK